MATGLPAAPATPVAPSAKRRKKDAEEVCVDTEIMKYLNNKNTQEVQHNQIGGEELARSRKTEEQLCLVGQQYIIGGHHTHGERFLVNTNMSPPDTCRLSRVRME